MGAKASKNNPSMPNEIETPMVEKKPYDGYVVPFNEKHLYHCKIEVKKFNAETGERMSKPRIQKFGIKTFQLVYPKLIEQGYTVDILYSPKK